jgi:uncharacterized protein
MIDPVNTVPTETFVKAQLADAEPGHDFSHALRVRSNARRIWQNEGGDRTIIEIAALMHDVADPKVADPVTALAAIKNQLKALNHTEEEIIQIVHIIQNISFTREKAGIPCTSLECRIVQDADRLDAIGAIGIARAFSYGGRKMRPLWNGPLYEGHEDSLPMPDESTIQHFYDKLLKLKDLMKTNTGKAMAAERHEFMATYLEHFFEEWGSDL